MIKKVCYLLGTGAVFGTVTGLIAVNQGLKSDLADLEEQRDSWYTRASNCRAGAEAAEHYFEVCIETLDTAAKTEQLCALRLARCQSVTQK